MTVVSDTSVLIAFESSGKLHILKKIFQQIIIPEGVYKELKVEKGEFVLENWIIVKKIANTDLFRRLYLGPGEGGPIGPPCHGARPSKTGRNLYL